jgi:cytochrome c oxidase subunit 2
MAGAWTSALAPAGPQAHHIGQLTWLLIASTGTVFVLVITVLAWAVYHARCASDDRSGHRPDQARDARMGRMVGLAVGATALILFGLLVASIWTERVLASLASYQAVTIAITGHQWWWEIEYQDPTARQRVLTANEFHLPIGRPVAVSLTSRDVIHSFWIPPLHGKRDLIPGYTSVLWLQADAPGRFRGQCAEFCGRQHAHMALEAIADDNDTFFEWLAHERSPAAEPATADARRGREVFLNGRCSTCHAIAGTAANGQVAPDLTHIPGRRTIGAGTLINTPDNLARWIQDSQRFKPGNQMPPQLLPAEDLRAVVAYLATLQ